jgi:hypothetical protein
MIAIETKISPHHITDTMNGMTTFTVLLVVVLVFGAIYMIDPTLFGLLGGSSMAAAAMAPVAAPIPVPPPGAIPPPSGSGSMEGFQANENAGSVTEEETKSNPNVAGGDVLAYDGPAQFGNAEAPAGCYPRDQLTPAELLPKDTNSVWAQQNPMGTGSLKGKNFLSAGALIGVNTVGQSMRNANLQLRSEPPNPQVPVSIFNVSTIEPDINRRPLEIS